MASDRKQYWKKYMQDYWHDPERYERWYENYKIWKKENIERRRYYALKNWYKTRGQLKLFYKRHPRLPLTYRQKLRQEEIKLRKKALPRRLPQIQDPEVKKAIIKFRSRLANTPR